jgi:hypothetical protein
MEQVMTPGPPPNQLSSYKSSFSFSLPENNMNFTDLNNPPNAMLVLEPSQLQLTFPAPVSYENLVISPLGGPSLRDDSPTMQRLPRKGTDF